MSRLCLKLMPLGQSEAPPWAEIFKPVGLKTQERNAAHSAIHSSFSICIKAKAEQKAHKHNSCDLLFVAQSRQSLQFSGFHGRALEPVGGVRREVLLFH